MFDHNSRIAHFDPRNICCIEEQSHQQWMLGMIICFEYETWIIWPFCNTNTLPIMQRLINANWLPYITKTAIELNHRSWKNKPSSRASTNMNWSPAASNLNSWNLPPEKIQLYPKKNLNLIHPILYIMHCWSQVSDLCRCKNKELIILIKIN